MRDGQAPDLSIEGYYLGAYCINATSLARAEVEWIVVFMSLSGEWVDRDGAVVYPFHVQPITDPTPTIPEGWIEHLHDLAHRNQSLMAEPKADLLTALGIRPRAPMKIDRRI